MPVKACSKTRCAQLDFTCDPGFHTIVAMDLADWVEEAALQGPAAVTQAIHALRRELRERDEKTRHRNGGASWVTFGRR